MTKSIEEAAAEFVASVRRNYAEIEQGSEPDEQWMRCLERGFVFGAQWQQLESMNRESFGL